MLDDERAARVLARFRRAYPPRHSYLDHRTPYQLLVAVALSAQTQDRTVNRVTPQLFARYPTPEAMAQADPADVLVLIGPVTFAPRKAEQLVAAAKMLCAEFDGELPRAMEDLTRLPGIGRKSASVVQGYVWNEADSVAVDTHVNRVAYRLALTHTRDPDKAADRLEELYARRDWPALNYYYIQHGRSTCRARRPLCGDCVVEDLCPKVDVTTTGQRARAAD